MKKKFLRLSFLLLVVAFSADAQWKFAKYFPDTVRYPIKQWFWGVNNGIAVDPAGKIWIQSYGWDSTVDSLAPGVYTGEILVFNPNGSPASFSPIKILSGKDQTGAAATDTLNGSGYGLSVDPSSGNILSIKGSSRIWKIDYQTGKGIVRNVFPIPGYSSSLATPMADNYGEVFLAPVLPGGAVGILNSNFTAMGTVLSATAGYARCIAVSADGKDVYVPAYTLKVTYVYHSDNGSLGPYVKKDSILKGLAVESMTWHPKTGYLWVTSGNVTSGMPDPPYAGYRWYAYNVATRKIVDSIVWYDPQIPPNGNDQRPRGIAFNPNGDTAYAAVFNSNVTPPSSWVEVFANSSTAVPPTAPTLSLPSNGATGVSTSPTISWNSSGATSYQLQVSTNSAFSSLVVNQIGITGTSYAVPGLANNTLYYWRVNATNASGTSAWSPTWRFTTSGTAPTLTVKLLSPNGGEVWNEDLPHTVLWQASDPSGAQISRIQILYSTDNGSTYKEIFNNVTNTGSKSWRVPRTPATKALVKVIAYNTAGDTASAVSAAPFTIQDVQTYVHRTGTLAQTVRNDGFTGAGSGAFSTSEPSLEYPNSSGKHYLYLGQVVLAAVTSFDTLANLSYQDEFLPADPLVPSQRAALSTVETRSRFLLKKSLGLSIEQFTLAPAAEGYIVYSFKVRNKGAFNLSNAYMAFYTDFDVNAADKNLSGYDAANKLAYVMDATSGWTGYAGIRLLTGLPSAFRRWSNTNAEPKTSGAWYQAVAKQVIDATSGDPVTDYRVMECAGPFNLLVGDSATFVFAMCVGDGISGVRLASQRAQQFWDGLSPGSTTLAATNVTSTSATLNAALDTKSFFTTVSFEYGTTTSYGSQIAVGSTSVSGNADAPITGLQPNTTYHYRVVATSEIGTSRAGDQSFTTLSAAPSTPTLASPSDGATGISTSPTFTWTVSPGATSYRVLVSTNSAFLRPVIDQSGITGTSYAATGLTDNTLYYWCMNATNAFGISNWSTTRSFTTIPAAQAPAVTTNAATSVGSTSATLNAFVDPKGSNTTVAFEYGTTTSYGSQIAVGSTSVAGNADAPLTGLIPSTTYHFRVVATNSAGTSRGANQSFTTLAAGQTPGVTTNAATNVATTSATLNGSVDPKGLSTAVTFEYGTTASYGSLVTAIGSPLTGTAAVNVGANVSGLTASTLYHYRVVATNSIGASRGSDLTFTTVAAGAVAVSATPSGWATGFSYPVTWTSSNVTGNVTIALSTNGGGSYTSLGDFPNSGSATVTVPSTAASTNCKLRISSASNTTVFGESGIFAIVSGTLPSTVQLSTSLSFPAQPTSSTSYRLVSYPGNVGTTRVGDILSGSPVYDWRIYKDNGNAADFLVEFNSASTMAVGEGYWLIGKGGVSLAKSVSAVSLGSDASYTIPLHTGWNIIGNPFLKSVSWSSVLSANKITTTATTRIQQYSGSYSESTSLEPYVGYYYFNSNLGGLKIPYPFAGKIETIDPGPPVLWKVQLKFSSDINEDSDNYIGIASSAKEGIDDLEGHKPPLFMDQGFLYFERPEWDNSFSLFNSDFRPSLGDGQAWDFTARNPRRSLASIRFTGVESVPPEFDVMLVNLSNTVPVDLRSQSVYSYRAADEITRFRLIIGKTQFMDSELATFVPTEYELFQNYPNPFNSATTIRAKIPIEGDVRLDVISLLGQTVKTLLDGWRKPGTYSVVWDGYDERGSGVASGVYFYRLVSNGKLVQTRKLTILK